MAMRSRRGGNLGLVLLATQLFGFGLENIPPVTLALIAGQAAIFLDMFPKYFPSANRVCMSSYLVYEHRDWQRMFLGAFYHANDMHLYFNMVSLLFKGTQLERKFGSPYFAYLVTVFTALVSATYVGLGLLMNEVMGDQHYLMSCAVGFSGVLFALKVLSTHYTPAGTQYIFGLIPVPSKHIFWVELVIIQTLVPNASFIGHLAGILVGIAYTYGPLKLLMDAFVSPGNYTYNGSSDPRSGYPRRGPRRSNLFSGLFRRSPRFHQTPYYGSTPTAPNAPYSNTNYANPSAPPYDHSGDYGHQNGYGAPPYPPEYDGYTGGMDEDEQYQRAIEESIRTGQPQPQPQTSSSSSSQRLYPDLDDLRSRRSRFYQ